MQQANKMVLIVAGVFWWILEVSEDDDFVFEDGGLEGKRLADLLYEVEEVKGLAVGG